MSKILHYDTTTYTTRRINRSTYLFLRALLFAFFSLVFSRFYFMKLLLSSSMLGAQMNSAVGPFSENRVDPQLSLTLCAAWQNMLHTFLFKYFLYSHFRESFGGLHHRLFTLSRERGVVTLYSQLSTP